MVKMTLSPPGDDAMDAQIDILQRVGGCTMKALGPVMMNTGLGVVRARVTLRLGGREILAHEVHLHHMSVAGWKTEVEMLTRGEMTDRQEIWLGVESPELILNVRRSESARESGGEAYYDFTIGVDAGPFSSDPSIAGEYIGATFSPSAEDLRTFARDLLDETEAVLPRWQRG
jgi:hypothetical protein